MGKSFKYKLFSTHLSYISIYNALYLHAHTYMHREDRSTLENPDHDLYHTLKKLPNMTMSGSHFSQLWCSSLATLSTMVCTPYPRISPPEKKPCNCHRVKTRASFKRGRVCVCALVHAQWLLFAWREDC